MTQSQIIRRQVNDKQRIQHTADLFGIRFPLNIEPVIYSIASNIATEYRGASGSFTV